MATLRPAAFSPEFLVLSAIVGDLQDLAAESQRFAPDYELIIAHRVSLVQVRDPESTRVVPAVLVESGTVSPPQQQQQQLKDGRQDGWSYGRGDGKRSFVVDGVHRSLHYGMLDACIAVFPDESIGSNQRIEFKSVDLTETPMEALNGGSDVAVMHVTPTQRDLALQLAPAEIAHQATRRPLHWVPGAGPNDRMTSTAELTESARDVPMYCVGRVCHALSQLQGVFNRQEVCSELEYHRLRDMKDHIVESKRRMREIQERQREIDENGIDGRPVTTHLRLTYGAYSGSKGVFAEDACVQVQEYVTAGGETVSLRRPVQIDVLMPENETLPVVILTTTVCPSTATTTSAATTTGTFETITPTQLKTEIPLTLEDVLDISKDLAREKRWVSQDAMVQFMGLVARKLEDRGFPDHARELRGEVERSVKSKFGVLMSVRMAFVGLSI